MEDSVKTFLDTFKEIDDENEKEREEQKIPVNFRINSKSEADDLLGDYIETKRKRKESAEYAKEKLEEYKKKVAEYEKKEIEPLDYKLERIESLLEEFYISSGETSRINLINGSIGLRKERDVIEYNSELKDKTIKSILKANPSLLKVTYAPIKNDIKKAARIDGEDVYINDLKIEGAKFKKGERVFNIKE